MTPNGRTGELNEHGPETLDQYLERLQKSFDELRRLEEILDDHERENETGLLCSDCQLRQIGGL